MKFAITIQTPRSYRDIKNGIRNWKNKARVCLSEISRALRKVRGLFKRDYKSEEHRPATFLKFCNERKSDAALMCCDCGGVIDIHNHYFIELFTCYDSAANEYAKTLLKHATQEVWPALPLDEMAECYCYAPFNTESKRARAGEVKARGKRQGLSIINGGGNA